MALDEGVAAKLAPKDTEPELLPNMAFFVGGIMNKARRDAAEIAEIYSAFDE